MGRTWVDGAIEQLSGVARVFMPPDGPCYECTLGHEDMKLISDRRSCNPLSKSDMVEGKVPTTPTAASIIAAVQCQEAVKVLHGLDALDGRGFTFNGLTNDSYVVSYQRRDDCTAHANYGDIRRLDVSTSGTTIAELLSIAKAELGEETVLEFNQEIVHVVECPTCQTRETVLRVLGKVDEDAGICKSCGEMRTPRLIHSVRGSEDFLGLTFSAVGVPTFDVIGGRNGHKQILLEFAGDASNALGPLHESWTNPVDTVSS
jgi:adenylyltransferase/sulfurtransferase